MKRKLTSTSIVLMLTVLSVFGVASASHHSLHSVASDAHEKLAVHSGRTGNWEVASTIHENRTCCDLNAGGGSKTLHID